jgi:hypothetical protein
VSGRGRAAIERAVPTCVHHISWIVPVEGGLHQCIQCQQIVSRKDVYPKLEDLGEELRRRWDEHEARGAAASGAPTQAKSGG